MADRPMASMASAVAVTTPSGFAAAATSSNLLEIESSKLALQQSRDPKVRRFAQHMISDHTRASRRLQATLRNSGMAPPPPQMEARHRQQLEALETSSPNGFDMNYVKLQEQAHQEAIGLFSAYAERGTDARLSAFARETLPTLQMHGQMLDSMPRPR